MDWLARPKSLKSAYSIAINEVHLHRKPSRHEDSDAPEEDPFSWQVLTAFSPPRPLLLPSSRT